MADGRRARAARSIRLALARGLAGAALTAGARIFTRSPAIAISHDGTAWTVETPKGRVTAGGLLLATNAYTDALHPRLKREIVPVLSWQMATTAADRQCPPGRFCPGRQAVSDTHGDLRFFRYDRDGRLVTGGALMVDIDAARRLKALVAERLSSAFPQIGEVAFSHVWNGYIGMTDRLHRRVFHRLGPDGYAWAGCNGRGVALSVAVGREFAPRARRRAGGRSRVALFGDCADHLSARPAPCGAAQARTLSLQGFARVAPALEVVFEKTIPFLG